MVRDVRAVEGRNPSIRKRPGGVVSAHLQRGCGQLSRGVFVRAMSRTHVDPYLSPPSRLDRQLKVTSDMNFIGAQPGGLRTCVSPAEALGGARVSSDQCLPKLPQERCTNFLGPLQLRVAVVNVDPLLTISVLEAPVFRPTLSESQQSFSWQVQRTATGAVRRLAELGILGFEELASGVAFWRVWHLLGIRELRHRYARSRLGQLWLTLSTDIMVAVLGGVWSLKLSAMGWRAQTPLRTGLDRAYAAFLEEHPRVSRNTRAR